MTRFFTRFFLVCLCFFVSHQKLDAQITIFSENWTSNSFGSWTFGPSQANWAVGGNYTPTGSTSPNAYFDFGNPAVLNNYSYALESPMINALAYMNLTLDAKIFLNNYTPDGLENLAVEYKAQGAGTWTTLVNYSNALSGTAQNWALVNQALSAVNQTNFQIRFRAWGTYSWNINGWGVDDIVIKGILATPCSGQPTAGVPTPFGSCPTTLTLVGTTLQANINVQWQSRPTCGGSWTNIQGATSWNYTLPPFSTPTQFRAFVVCTNTNQPDTSSILTLNSVSPCYCNSGASSGSFEDITNVTLGSLNNSSACANSVKTNFTSLPATRVTKGTAYPFAVTVSNCGTTNNPTGVAIFIDADKNGTYSAAERLYSSSTNSSGNFTVAGNITIPASAGTGITGMRVIAAYNISGSAFTGCDNNYLYGETEDYLVDIQYAPTVTGTSLNTSTYTATYCSGENVTLTATTPNLPGALGVVWKKPNNTWDTSHALTMNNIQPNNSGYYFVYALTPGCPGGPPDTTGARLIFITVNPTPAAPIVSPNVYVCQNAPFDSVEVYGENITWYTVPTGGTPVIAPKNLNTSQAATYTYYVTQTTDGCEGPRAPVTITISPKPQPPSVVSPVGYCQDMPSTPLVANGQNVRWYSVSTGGIGTPTAPSPSTAAQGTFTWYATQTVAGCESNRKPVVVNVSYVPNGLITINRPYVCQYDTISLGYFGNALTTASYVWDLPAGANIVSGSGQGPLVIRFDSAGAQTVKLTIDNGGCVGPLATFDVPVHLSPRLTIDTQPDACIDQTVSLAITHSTIGIDSFAWDFSGGEMIYGSMPRGPFGLRWNNAGDKVITVIATDDGCKSLPSYDTISIHNNPDATISVTAASICSGDSMLFTAPYEPGASYQWLPHQFFGETNSNTVWGAIDFSRYVVLNVTNSYNCKQTDSIMIEAKPCCQVYFPSAFSPNGDGKNDRFRMLTMSKDQNSKTSAHQISTFRIQNRWGQTVFETADEINGWDGSYNGEPQDPGVYNFYVKYKCSDGKFYEEKGEVTLVR